jgi:hypothetical protein
MISVDVRPTYAVLFYALSQNSCLKWLLVSSMSVHPSYHLAAWNRLAPAGRNLVTYWGMLLKSVDKIQVYLHSDINNIHCAWRSTGAVSCLIPREINLRNTTSYSGSDAKDGSRAREVEKIICSIYDSTNSWRDNVFSRNDVSKEENDKTSRCDVMSTSVYAVTSAFTAIHPVLNRNQRRYHVKTEV